MNWYVNVYYQFSMAMRQCFSWWYIRIIWDEWNHFYNHILILTLPFATVVAVNMSWKGFFLLMNMIKSDLYKHGRWSTYWLSCTLHREWCFCEYIDYMMLSIFLFFSVSCNSNDIMIALKKSQKLDPRMKSVASVRIVSSLSRINSSSIV